MRKRIRVKYTMLTVIVALLMVFVFGCQMMASMVSRIGENTADQNKDFENSSQTGITDIKKEKKDEDGEDYDFANYHNAGDLSKTSGVSVLADEFIKGYTVNDVNILFEEGSLDNGNVLYDSLIVNDKVFGEKFYSEGVLSDLYFNQYAAQYFYTEEGKISEAISGGITLKYVYDHKGRLERILENDEIFKLYYYSEDDKKGRIEENQEDIFRIKSITKDVTNYVAELDYKNNLGGLYIFSDTGELEIKYDIERSNSIFWPSLVEYNRESKNDTTLYVFGHNYNGNKYMTQRIVRGDNYDNRYNYEYINDKIVSETIFDNINLTHYTLTYIFDNQFNRTGFYYNNELFYYVFDAFGNTEKIIDIDGNEVVKYRYDLYGKFSYDFWGDLVIEGSRKEDIGVYNSYIYRASDDWYYDFNLEYYYVASNKIFNAKAGSFIKGNSEEFIEGDLNEFISNPINKTIKNGEIQNFKPLIKRSLTEETLIKEKISVMAGQNLSAENIKTYSNILVWEYGLDILPADEEGVYHHSTNIGEKSSVGRADIYTSTENINKTDRGDIFGSQIYILGNSNDLSYAQKKLYNFTGYNSYVYDGFERYYAYAGEISFEGHFVYLDKYVTYRSTADGIIEYKISPNISTDIYKRDTGNLYNFDTERYILFYGSNTKFEGVERISNVNYVSDWEQINKDFIDGLYKTEGLGYFVEGTYSTYYSEEAALELQRNSYEGNGIKWFGGYDLEELEAEMGDNFMFTSKDGETTVVEKKSKDDFDLGEFLTDIVIGVGIIVIASTVIAITGGSATPFVCFLVTSATLTSISIAGGALAAGIAMASGGDWQDALMGFSNGFMITAAVSSTVTATTGTGACFVAGTEIKTANGIKTIENIKEGDLVLSYNEEMKKTEYRPVEKTFVRKTFEKINIKTAKDNIITTPEHPFYSDGRWIQAKDLRAGDMLQNVNGKAVIVEQVQHELLENPLTVYNFRVNKNHNYYIGSGILVHNASYGAGASAALKLPAASFSASSGLSLTKILLFTEISAVTLVVGGSISIPQHVTVEDSISKAAKKPRVREWPLLDYTANGGEMNMNTNFIPGYEINYKLHLQNMNFMNFLQALAYLHLLGAINSGGKYTQDYLPYLNDPYVREDVDEAIEATRGKRNVHFGVYTECPSHAMELGVAAGCPVIPGYVKAPEDSVFYGDAEGSVNAYIVATDNFPGYYHLRGPNDAFRIWCMYPLVIRENQIRWLNPLRDPKTGLMPKDNTYIYDPMYIWSDQYMEYQEWLLREYADEYFEWEWWSVW